MTYSMLKHLTIEELQKLGRTGNNQSLIELGKKVLDFNFCLSDGKGYCSHEEELEKLEQILNNEPPLDCPHCGKLIG